MSTKMYNYRIAKELWWPFAKASRAYYMAHYPIVKLLKSIAESEATTGTTTYKSMMNAISAVVDSDWTVDLQIFDEGDTYLIRPVEHGYFFMNNFDKWDGCSLERVTYDNRGDVPPEDEKNEAVAEWVDKKILDGEYLIFTVLNRDDFVTICFDELLAKRVGG